ncbi:MAG TPA: (deoxy)nucleoside triphosphate pyrophosphohydrolase [Thermoanaerobaculaceae bacterium]|nr:(deoxy)nucleoside triphosphate pyrophosphohydrolase [Thermoanaerobaculaceae bacterium]
MPRRRLERNVRIVVAAVVQRGDGRFLLARRLPGSHLGGLWEFPGGAVEPGETPEEALRRELVEELGVAITVEGPMTFAFHRDDERDVLLLFHRCAIAAGTPAGLLGQEVGWFAPGELVRLETPPADAALIATLAAGSE